MRLDVPPLVSSPHTVSWTILHRAQRIGARDRRILALALRKLGERTTFDDAVRAVREAVEESIPAGRIFLLGDGDSGPIVGSIASGVGITDGVDGVTLVHVDRDGRRLHLGAFRR